MSPDSAATTVTPGRDLSRGQLLERSQPFAVDCDRGIIIAGKTRRYEDNVIEIRGDNLGRL